MTLFQIAHPMTGGISLNTQRGASLTSPAIIPSEQPPQLIFPLHTSYCRYTPLVRQGDIVQAGQPIAQTPSKQTLHTGLAGTVHLNSQTIIIQTHTTATALKSNSTSSTTTNTSCINTMTDLQKCLTQAGIVGLGGAMFPTAQKLQPKLHTFIANGVECEPMLTADACVMTHQPKTIVQGIQQLISILNIPRASIAIEDDKPLAIRAIEQQLSDTPHIQLHIVKSQYPSGGARQLFEQLTGSRLAGKEHSISKGVLTLNVQTILAVQQALQGQPLTHRVITLAGDALHQSVNMWLPIGTPLSWIRSQLKLKPGQSQVTRGGPLMGSITENPNEPVQAGTSAFLFQIPRTLEVRACIQCGDCNPVCPEALHPQSFIHQIHAQQQAPRSEADQALASLNLDHCIACGACDLVCPSQIPLAQEFKSAQKQLSQRQAQDDAALRARQKYEARQTRLKKTPRANPPLPPTKKHLARRPVARKPKSVTALKTQLSKSQRLAREARAALEQARKKNLDADIMTQYQQRLDALDAKVLTAQAAYNAAITE